MDEKDTQGGRPKPTAAQLRELFGLPPEETSPEKMTPEQIAEALGIIPVEDTPAEPPRPERGRSRKAQTDGPAEISAAEDEPSPLPQAFPAGDRPAAEAHHPLEQDTNPALDKDQLEHETQSRLVDLAFEQCAQALRIEPFQPVIFPPYLHAQIIYRLNTGKISQEQKAIIYMYNRAIYGFSRVPKPMNMFHSMWIDVVNFGNWLRGRV